LTAQTWCSTAGGGPGAPTPPTPPPTPPLPPPTPPLLLLLLLLRCSPGGRSSKDPTPGLRAHAHTHFRRRALACRGFGVVRFATPEQAEEAAEKMNNATIGGRVVSVRIDRFA
jgi:hypothetical protein